MISVDLTFVKVMFDGALLGTEKKKNGDKKDTPYDGVNVFSSRIDIDQVS